MPIELAERIAAERMEIQDCPLPEVASALGPFIKPREEVAAIRRSLQAYLEKQLPKDAPTLASVNFATPPDTRVGEPPAALTGVRRAYWKALQSNQAAQAKYDTLKADLDTLKRRGPATETSSINDDYLPLLRQKEKYRRLKVLERAYTSLPPIPTDSLDDQLKAQLGEQPAPPSNQPPPTSERSPDVDAKILDLKKAVLTTKRRADEQQARNTVHRAPASPDGEEDHPSTAAQIAGLQNALQELTGWMEAVLAIIANAEAAAAAAGHAVPPTPGSATHTSGPSRDPDAIETAYERYLAARHRLIRAMRSAPSSGAQNDQDDDGHEPLFPSPPSPGERKSNPQAVSPAHTLLPFIPALTSAKAQEAALVQQHAHVRRALSASEGETARLVRRLAGESHLVQPGASRGGDWAAACGEAGRETEKVVRERVRAGERAAEEAEAALEAVGALPGAL